MQLIIRDLIYRSPLKYDSDLDVIYFDTCHPSHRGGHGALEYAYDCMLSEYSDFLED